MGEYFSPQDRSFSMALSRLRAGYKLQRDGWKGLEANLCYIELKTGHPDSKMYAQEQTLIKFQASGVPEKWDASQEDILANDWRVIE